MIPHLIPPHPDMDRAMRRATAMEQRKPWQMPLGMDAPARPAARGTIPGQANWLVVPVGFSDKPFQIGPGFFDDLFFGGELHPDMDLNGDRMIDSVDIQTLVDILRT